ncbi:glutaredoxin family protein [Candidatus Pacearchaeota archaeon]|nr:glutaredoxin family protein [Candidatus Pacearchaeota archaeon]
MPVTIYSTSTCPFCKAAKSFFKEHKIKFKDIDVSKNKKAAEEAYKKSGVNAVPVIDINGIIIIGFDQNKIEKALKL